MSESKLKHDEDSDILLANAELSDAGRDGLSTQLAEIPAFG